MPLLLNPDIKSFFESTLLLSLQSDKSGIFTNEGRVNEPRVVAENVQEMCKQRFSSCFTSGIIQENLSNELTRRSMGDIYVIDSESNHYYVDVKTHNLDTDFNMPNLTSIDRLSKYYARPNTNNYFLILLVEYTLSEQGVNFNTVNLFPIENLSWNCLQIESLGWGQIQIKNANKVEIDTEFTRNEWMIQFYDHVNAYYNIVLQKAKERQNIMQTRANEWNDD